jgi:hypothetical protein
MFFVRLLDDTVCDLPGYMHLHLQGRLNGMALHTIDLAGIDPTIRAAVFCVLRFMGVVGGLPAPRVGELYCVQANYPSCMLSVRQVWTAPVIGARILSTIRLRVSR